MGVPVPDRVDKPGQMVNRSPGGIQAAMQQATREAFISGGRFVENASGWSLNSGRGLQRGLQRLLPLVVPKGLDTSHLSAN